MKPATEAVHDAPLPETPEKNEQARREATVRVKQFQRRSLRGLWYLTLFLGVSLAAQQGFSHFLIFRLRSGACWALLLPRR